MKIVLAIAALLLPAAAFSQNVVPRVTEIGASAKISLKSDKAYLLFRTTPSLVAFPTEPVFLYLFEPPIVERSPNVFPIDVDHPFAKSGLDDIFLVEATPGDYLLLGVKLDGDDVIDTCMCFGTVRFKADAGKITDLGYIFADRIDRVSKVPELEPVTGKQPRISIGARRLTMAVRPFEDGAPVPAALATLPRVPADYRAVAKFRNRIALDFNRLPAIPGVLAYDEDRVVDPKGPDSEPQQPGQGSRGTR